MYQILLKNTRESKTSQLCLPTVIQTHLSNNESARSISQLTYKSRSKTV